MGGMDGDGGAAKIYVVSFIYAADYSLSPTLAWEGFAAFFSIFEITRQASAMVRASTFTDTLLAKSEQTRKRSKRILNGVILVTGGVRIYSYRDTSTTL